MAVATIEQTEVTSKQAIEAKYQEVLTNMKHCQVCVPVVVEQSISFEKVCLHHRIELTKIGY